MRISLLILFLLGAFFACKKQSVNTSGGKFAAQLNDPMWGENNRLISHVHKSEWTIAYEFHRSCNIVSFSEDKAFEDAISRAIQLWLEPIQKIAGSIDKSVAVNLKYTNTPPLEPPHGQHNKTPKEQSHQTLQIIKTQEEFFKENNVKLHIHFSCSSGTSHTLASPSKLPSINMLYDYVGEHTARHDKLIGDSYFSFAVLFHEMGHAFGLLDTYPPRKAGQITHNRGQPASIMSCSLTGDALGEDDIKGIQWLYRYTHAKETIPKENPCFFDDYEKLTPGVCVPKHPLITRLKQAEAHDRLGNIYSANYIITGTDRMVDQHVVHDTNKINAQDEDGNTALHLAVKYYIEAKKRHPQHPSSWSFNLYLPDDWTKVGLSLLYLRRCPSTGSTGEQRKQDLQLLYDNCVKNKNRTRETKCVCIDPQIKNNEGKTARDLAVDANAADIVQAIDAALNRP